MRPLNYAILKYMTTVEKASAVEVVAALKDEYGRFRMLNEAAVQEALMTAEQNALLEEAGYTMDDDETVHIYFSATPSGTEMIHRYIK